MEFAGEFETHLTVQLVAANGIDALRRWAEERSLKCTHIVLARGASASQPMLTREGKGTLSAELQTASRLADELNVAGFRVTRVKIEASLWNKDIPATKGKAAAHPPERYFEHHFKLLLDADADIARLTALAQQHGAHVSRNALRLRDDGRQERFVTQRCHRVGRGAAAARLEILLSELRSGGYEMIEVEREFVVYDNNLALDRGWIEP